MTTQLKSFSDASNASQRRLKSAAGVMLAALRQALLEMEYVNRPGSKITRKQCREAIIKATGEAPNTMRILNSHDDVSNANQRRQNEQPRA